MPRRFDRALMQPPQPSGADLADTPLLATLRAWCEERSDAFLVASIAPGGLDDAACVLDGSVELARLGRWRGRWWRLQIVWAEMRGARGAGAAGIPWDCGWWRAAAPARVAEAFRPRRPTLLMVREGDAASAGPLLATLHAVASAGSHTPPLRVLLVSVKPPAGIERLRAGVIAS